MAEVDRDDAHPGEIEGEVIRDHHEQPESPQGVDRDEASRGRDSGWNRGPPRRASTMAAPAAHRGHMTRTRPSASAGPSEDNARASADARSRSMPGRGRIIASTRGGAPATAVTVPSIST